MEWKLTQSTILYTINRLIEIIQHFFYRCTQNNHAFCCHCSFDCSCCLWIIYKLFPLSNEDESTMDLYWYHAETGLIYHYTTFARTTCTNKIEWEPRYLLCDPRFWAIAFYWYWFFFLFFVLGSIVRSCGFFVCAIRRLNCTHSTNANLEPNKLQIQIDEWKVGCLKWMLGDVIILFLQIFLIYFVVFRFAIWDVEADIHTLLRLNCSLVIRAHIYLALYIWDCIKRAVSPHILQ